MTCRSEHWTRENRGVPALRLQHQLSVISHRWPARLQQEKSRARLNRILAHRQEKKRFRKAVLQTKRKVRAWQLRTLRKQLLALSDKHAADPSSVTPEDWDRATAGSERKVQYILSKEYPRSAWPARVPYLNIIALRQYREKRKQLKAQREQMKAQREKVRLTAPAQDLQSEIQAETRKHLANVEAQTRLSQEDAQMQEETRKYMASVDAQIEKMKFQTAQHKQQYELLARCQDDPLSVTLEEWEHAIEGWEPGQIEPPIAQRIRFARRRAAGEDVKHYWLCSRERFDENG